MLLTASKMAACSMAKLRVECIVGDWAPGVRTIVSSVLFHSMTGLADCAGWSSLFVAAALAKPVAELQKPAHRIASVRTLFPIEITSPSGFSANAGAWLDHRRGGGPVLPTRITEQGRLYSNGQYESGVNGLC